VVEQGYTEDLKSSVRKDLQVRILPPLPSPIRSPADIDVTQRAAYSYLLGVYLGDGYICRTPRTYRLEISLHSRQEIAIAHVAGAIGALRPGRPVGFRRRGVVTVVNAYWNTWPILFPQHGAGRKHHRPIVLAPWQRPIVEQYPVEFLRGCIDSDGCRHRRIVAGRNYPAYSFTNHSLDILGLFVWACGLIGLRPRRANRVTVSLARRTDVARLDHLFGQPMGSSRIQALARS
jgi:hypothetical protein